MLQQTSLTLAGVTSPGSIQAHTRRLKHGVKWAAAMAVVFSLLAAAGLTSYPGGQIWDVLLTANADSILHTLNAYSLMFVVVYWTTSPPIVERRLVFAGSCSLAILMVLLSGEINFGSWASAFGIPAIVAFAIRAVSAQRAPGSTSEEGRYVLWLLLLMGMLILFPTAGLDLTATLHPLSYDIVAARWELAAGLNIATGLRRAVDGMPGLGSWLTLCYGLTPVAFLALTLIQRRGTAPHLPTAAWLWVVLSGSALIAYHFFPIGGPLYIFGPSRMDAGLASVAALPLSAIPAGPFPRNGMPSMHFGWMLAVTIVWWSSETPRWSRVAVTLMTVSVACATLYLGEHYLIDLMVAVPFVLAGIALGTAQIPWSAPPRWGAVSTGFSTWLIWIILLRTQTPWFIEHRWGCWALIAATAGVVWCQACWLREFRFIVPLAVAPMTADSEGDPVPAARSMRSHRRLAFASGAAGLAVSLLLARHLAQAFGGDASACLAVLAALIASLAVGSLIGGTLARRLANPLRAFAMLELATACCCAMAPTLFGGIQAAFVAMVGDSAPGSAAFVGLRLLVCLVALIVPVALIGSTGPVLARAMGQRGGAGGGNEAGLFVVSTAGAATLALLATYWILPVLGMRSTTLLAALLAMLVALAALELAKSRPVSPIESSSPETSGRWAALSLHDRGAGLLDGLTLGFGGALSIGLALLYWHLLRVVADGNAYAVGLILFLALAGLFGGGDIGRRLLAMRRLDRPAAVALIQSGLALSVAIGAWWWNMIPAYFGSFAEAKVRASFVSTEAVRGFVCALVTIPPAMLVGAGLVIGMDLASRAPALAGARGLGRRMALNLAGQLVGLIVFGLWILPAAGGVAATKFVAGGAMLGAAVSICRSASWASRWATAGVGAVAVAAMVASPAHLDAEQASTGATVYFSPLNWGRVIDHAESLESGLVSVARTSDAVTSTTLLVNGRPQGSDAVGRDLRSQIATATAPLLHQAARDKALVIGYGTGIGARIFSDAGFASVDIAEPSADLVRLANHHLGALNARITSRPGVALYAVDGRGFLLTSRDAYDVIGLQTSSIDLPGTASLYNQDFYQLVKQHLRPSGVLQQRLELHRLAPEDLLYIIATLRSEFRFISLYVVAGQGILIATDDERHADPKLEQARGLELPDSLDAIAGQWGQSLETTLDERLLAPAATDEFLSRVGVSAEAWISTDRHSRLEYSAAKANVNDLVKTLQRNLALLKRLQ